MIEVPRKYQGKTISISTNRFMETMETGMRKTVPFYCILPNGKSKSSPSVADGLSRPKLKGIASKRTLPCALHPPYRTLDMEEPDFVRRALEQDPHASAGRN